jgi:hypothetical protein
MLPILARAALGANRIGMHQKVWISRSVGVFLREQIEHPTGTELATAAITQAGREHIERCARDLRCGGRAA